MASRVAFDTLGRNASYTTLLPGGTPGTVYGAMGPRRRDLRRQRAPLSDAGDHSSRQCLFGSAGYCPGSCEPIMRVSYTVSNSAWCSLGKASSACFHPFAIRQHGVCRHQTGEISVLAAPQSRCRRADPAGVSRPPSSGEARREKTLSTSVSAPRDSRWAPPPSR